MTRFTAETLRAFVPAVDLPYQSALVFERVFSRRDCERIVAAGRALEADDARIGASQADFESDAATRIARTAWIPPDDEHLWIFDALTDVALRANETYGFDLLGFTEDLQFTTYDEPGAFYDWHQDGLEGEVATRKLSLVAQITPTSRYRGGELRMFNVEEDWALEDAVDWRRRAKRLGSVIAFPAFEYHQVTPLERGTRHSLVAWIGGPPFR